MLMVCLGNICRSPTARGVLEKMARDAGLGRRIEVDSAGIGDWHVGAPPDPRALEHAARRGYDLSHQRARQITRTDFERFDLILVMDTANERAIRALCPLPARHKLRRLPDFCTRHRVREIPDPYTGNSASFERVLDLVEDACAGLLRAITR